MVKKDEPQVTIIMATYNRGHFIWESLEAIVNQTFKDWECLVIDDGSKDETEAVVSKFTKRDSRIKYLKRPEKYQKGLPGSRNYGLDLAKGKFIVFFDDDDIPHPQVLELTLSQLNDSKDNFCRYQRSTFTNHFEEQFENIEEYSTRKVTVKDIESIIKNELPFNSCQVVWRNSSIAKERFNESLMYAEEWEFYSRLMSKGLKGTSIEKVLYFGRKHPNSNTGEYYRKKPVRLNSQLKATLLVIENLSSHILFSERLKIFFIRMGFELNSLPVIMKTLDASGSTSMEKFKYRFGYYLYPVFKPIFSVKAKFSKN